MWATPIINYPEVAILAVMRIYETAVVVNGKLKTRYRLPLIIGFDHRVVDGAQAAKFMNTLKEHLEDPGLLLLES